MPPPPPIQGTETVTHVENSESPKKVVCQSVWFMPPGNLEKKKHKKFFVIGATNTKETEFIPPSGALWQGSNSKIENYCFLAAVALFEKVLQSFLACRRK